MRPRSAGPSAAIVMTGCSAAARRSTTSSLSAAAPARRRAGAGRRGRRRRRRARRAARRRPAARPCRACPSTRRSAARPTGRSDSIGGSTTNVSLSRPRERQLADRAAEPEAGVRRPGRPSRSAAPSSAAPSSSAAQVGAEQRGRDEAEVRQRAVAPADVGVVEEDAPEAALLAERREPRARIGDGDELRAVAAGLLPEVVEGRQRLDRPAGLRRDDEQRLGDVDLGLDVARPRRRRSSRARAGSARRRACRTSAGTPPAPATSRPCRARPPRSARRRGGLRRTPRARRPRPSSRSWTSSQPSRLLTSGWPAGPQSVSSRSKIRRATSSAPARARRAAIAGSYRLGIDASIPAGAAI